MEGDSSPEERKAHSGLDELWGAVLTRPKDRVASPRPFRSAWSVAGLRKPAPDPARDAGRVAGPGAARTGLSEERKRRYPRCQMLREQRDGSRW